jgi:hypothetical protein
MDNDAGEAEGDGDGRRGAKYGMGDKLRGRAGGAWALSMGGRCGRAKQGWGREAWDGEA